MSATTVDSTDKPVAKDHSTSDKGIHEPPTSSQRRSLEVPRSSRPNSSFFKTTTAKPSPKQSLTNLPLIQKALQVVNDTLKIRSNPSSPRRPPLPLDDQAAQWEKQLSSIPESKSKRLEIASRICLIRNPEALKVVFYVPWVGRVLCESFCEAVGQRAQGAGGEWDRKLAVFGTAFFHLYLSVGSFDQLKEIISEQTLDTTGVSDQTDKSKALQTVLSAIWSAVPDTKDPIHTTFTSVSLASGLLLTCTQGVVSSGVFYDENELLSNRLNGVSALDPPVWNHLALLALVCNSHGGKDRSEDGVQDFWKDVQTAYNTAGSSHYLTTQIFRALRGHPRIRTRLPTDVFKLAWKLLVACPDEDVDEKDANQALGQHVPFLGILEAKIRDDEMDEDYRRYFGERRAECFEIVMATLSDCARKGNESRPTTNQKAISLRAEISFKAIEHFATCIICLEDGQDNTAELELVTRAKDLVKGNKAPFGSPNQPWDAYDSLLFERACERFEKYAREGRKEEVGSEVGAS